MTAYQGSAVVSNPRDVPVGRWATEQLARALAAGQPLDESVLRTCDVLRKDEWKAFDNAVVEEAIRIRRGVADLIAAGLTTTVPRALGKTIFEYETVSDMEEAIISMSGVERSDNDRQEYERSGVPLPMTHKDFDVDLRELEASRNGTRPIDTTRAGVAGRKVSEKQEEMLFEGGPTFGGLPIYGYTTHPQRIPTSFGTNGAWSAAAKTGPNILADVQAGKTLLRNQGFRGPYWVYSGDSANEKLDDDYNVSGTSVLSIRDRVLKIEGVEKLETTEFLADDEVIIVQATKDVITWLQGIDITNAQWDLAGGFRIAFKVYAIGIPLIRATQSGKVGVLHMS